MSRRLVATLTSVTVYDVTCDDCPDVHQRFERHDLAVKFLRAHNDLHSIADASHCAASTGDADG